MELELKDVSTGKLHTIPVAGLVFGRQSGDADIKLSDMGVSKRHARIFGEGGAWFIEDLGSSNGTFVQSERVTEPVELLPGDVVQLSKLRFEVTRVIGGAAHEPQSGSVSTERSDLLQVTAQPSQKRAKPTASARLDDVQAPTGVGPSVEPAAAEGVTSHSARTEHEAEAQSNESADARADRIADGPAAAAAAVPLAVRFYLAELPQVLKGPASRLAEFIAEQPAPPHRGWSLVGWLLPPLLVAAVLNGAAGLVASGMKGEIALALLSPLGQLVGALAGAALAGFLWHPVLGRVVSLLGGEADDRSLTNHALTTAELGALVAVPNALATVLEAAPVNALVALATLVRLSTFAAAVYMHLQWFAHYRVASWFRTAALGLAGIVTVAMVIASVATLFKGSPSPSSPPPAFSERVRPMPAGPEPQPQAVEPAPKAAERAAAAPTPVPAPTEIRPPAPSAADAPAAAPAAQAAPAPNADAEAQTQRASYAQWRTKYDAIEKKVTDDPTVLSRTPGVLSLYRLLSEQSFEVETKYQKLTQKKPSDQRLNAHLREAELYEKTEKTVRELYGKLLP